jgi:hypothetical protein
MSRLRMLRWSVAVVAFGCLALELYARLPSRVAVVPLGLAPGTRTVILLFHGRRGRDEPTLAALEQGFRTLTANRSDVVVRRYAWTPHSDTRFRSAQNGARIGALLGAELAGSAAVEAVHLVGHSAGAYLLDPLCEALRERATRPVHVEMTFLDPIGFQGAFDWGWGARHYGACADYAEAFINTDDGVPGTNAPLAQAFNVDVTAAGRRAAVAAGGHRWPVRYYLGQLGLDDVVPGAHVHATRPRGAVERR